MKKQAVALLVAALTVALGGSLALAMDDPPRPVLVEDETVDDTSVDDTTVDDTDVDEADVEADDTEIEDDGDDAKAGDAAEHPENHGKFVSEAAREGCADAENHGQCVREVARSEAGKTVDPLDDATGDDAVTADAQTHGKGKAKTKG